MRSVKVRFPLWPVAVALLSAAVSSTFAQTARRSDSPRLKRAFTQEPGWIYDRDASRPVGVVADQPALQYYGNGALRAVIDPAPPLREVQIDDLPLPSATPIVVPSPTPISTPFPTPTANPTPNPTPTAVPSASPSPFGSPPVPPRLPSPPPPPPVPPPPRPAPILPPPVALPKAIPVPPNPVEVLRLTPVVEVWRTGAILPQVPSRHGSLLNPVYVTGAEPFSVRVRLDPLMAGRHVRVISGKGFVIDAGPTDLAVSVTGECTFSGHLGDGFERGHVIFYSEGVKTVLPVLSVPAPLVQAQEAQTQKR